MKKKEILDEVLHQLMDLKKDIRDLKMDISKILEKENISSVQVPNFYLNSNICKSCNLDISKGIVCMSTNCPNMMTVTCSTGQSK